MAVTLSRDQLKDLLEKLKTETGSIVITSELQTSLDHNVPNFDFIVDAWPDFKALLLRPCPGSIENSLLVFAKKHECLRCLLKQPHIVNWTDKVKFAAFDTRLRPTVNDVVSLYKQSVKCSNEFCILSVKRNSLRLRQVPEDLTLSRLNPDQCELVNSNWIRRGEGTSDYIRFLIETFPSSCLYDRERNLVGYVLAYHYGCLGMLHVPEEHRGKGYAKVVVTQLADKCLQTCDSVYVVIEASNKASLELHQSLGFEIMEDFRVCWISGK